MKAITKHHSNATVPKNIEKKGEFWDLKFYLYIYIEY
jgi:hypothetical protein